MKTFGEVDVTCPKCKEPLRRAYDHTGWHLVCAPCQYVQSDDAMLAGKPLYKPARARLEPEHDIQASFFEYANLMAQKDYRWGLIYAVPNGGKRSPKTAAKLKEEGVKAGVPDVCVPCAGMVKDPFADTGEQKSFVNHALYIEFKAGRNSMTTAQHLFANGLVKMGNHHVVCRSAEEAIDLVTDWLSGKEV